MRNLTRASAVSTPTVIVSAKNANKEMSAMVLVQWYHVLSLIAPLVSAHCSLSRLVNGKTQKVTMIHSV